MSIRIIPIERLSPEAIQGVIEEFILREGIDYGEKETSMEINIHQVRTKLEKGLSVLVFDDESETTSVLHTDDPALKKIKSNRCPCAGIDRQQKAITLFDKLQLRF